MNANSKASEQYERLLKQFRNKNQFRPELQDKHFPLMFLYLGGHKISPTFFSGGHCPDVVLGPGERERGREREQSGEGEGHLSHESLCFKIIALCPRHLLFRP